ncbi:MAG: hypothetical protein U1F01_00335 [Acinetobacter sp.]
MKLKQLEKHMWAFETLIDEDIEQQFDEALEYLSQGSLLASELTLTNYFLSIPNILMLGFILGWFMDILVEKWNLISLCVRLIVLDWQYFPFNWDKDLLEWGFIENRPF